MPKLPKLKIFFSIVCTIFAIIFAMPNFTDTTNSSFLPSDKVNLGLDLRGGAHLLLDVDFDRYLEELMETVTETLRKEFREARIGYKNLRVADKAIEFDIRDQEHLEQVRKMVKKIDQGLVVEIKSNNKVRIFYKETSLKPILDRVIDRSIEIVRLRVDSTGTKEPIIQRQGSKHILLQVPGEDDPENLKKVLGKTAKLTMHLVDENATAQKLSKGNLPPGLISVNSSEGNNHQVILKKKVLISGDQLLNAQASVQEGRPVVSFALNSVGGKTFAEVTQNNIGKRLAIVLDNNLLSAPSINGPIPGGQGIISGNFTFESASDLALLLRSGALPAPLLIIEERTIGPNLGADSIEAGTKAGIIGFIAVAVFMVWSYGILGIFANVALSLALLYILALLSLFQATLTLPGIAGIILTIGMAVDANVLIYERIKEELQKGGSNLYSIRQGFETAFATITDSNITTLIAALLLYIFGVGAIKGFAVTLTIGILASMFTAIVITKLLVDLWMIYFKPKNLGL